jgi:hypothetical protein
MRNRNEIQEEVIAALGEAFKHGERDDGPFSREWVSCAFTLPDDLIPEKIEICAHPDTLVITTKEGLSYSIKVRILES